MSVINILSGSSAFFKKYEYNINHQSLSIFSATDPNKHFEIFYLITLQHPVS